MSADGAKNIFMHKRRVVVSCEAVMNAKTCSLHVVNDRDICVISNDNRCFIPRVYRVHVVIDTVLNHSP
jgi:hypothetical protein